MFEGLPAGRRFQKSTWRADIFDRMNRIDRMTQTHIQILSILSILSEIYSVFVCSRRVPIGTVGVLRFERARRINKIQIINMNVNPVSS